MAAITIYPVQCVAFPDIPPHIFEVLKTTADALITSQGYVTCPICRTNNPASVVQANTIVSST